MDGGCSVRKDNLEEPHNIGISDMLSASGKEAGRSVVFSRSSSRTTFLSIKAGCQIHNRVLAGVRLLGACWTLQCSGSGNTSPASDGFFCCVWGRDFRTSSRHSQIVVVAQTNKPRTRDFLLICLEMTTRTKWVVLKSHFRADSGGGDNMVKVLLVRDFQER